MHGADQEDSGRKGKNGVRTIPLSNTSFRDQVCMVSQRHPSADVK
jgi:hypothetical protein